MLGVRREPERRVGAPAGVFGVLGEQVEGPVEAAATGVDGDGCDRRREGPGLGRERPELDDLFACRGERVHTRLRSAPFALGRRGGRPVVRRVSLSAVVLDGIFLGHLCGATRPEDVGEPTGDQHDGHADADGDLATDGHEVASGALTATTP